MEYKVDLHTHSELSYDGVMKLEDYKKILDQGLLDYVAVTDHNEIDNALRFRDKIGDQIIVGEEIKTDAGDMIGLFVEKKIPKGTNFIKAAEMIKEQGGLVYIPHPFDRMRSGIKVDRLVQILPFIDIIEGFNARYIMPGGNVRAATFGIKNSKAIAAGSDSHSYKEIGNTYNIVDAKPGLQNLVSLIQNGKHIKKYVSPINYLNPKVNKLRKVISKREQI